ncbi:MAG: DsbC family protein [Alcaligenaceae bacterium]|nr:DsbC family protein [Alcaligenaceae bacterium]
MSNQVATLFKKISCIAVAGLSLMMAQATIAQTVEESIKKNLSDRISLPIAEVHKTPFDNLYEVRVQGNVVYTDADGKFVIFSGQLYDLEKKVNLTELAVEEMNRVDIDSLPLELALKATYGKGGNDRIVTFEDPNCPWCKRLQAEFKKMDVTVYTFVTPMLSADSFVKSRNILCAKEPVKTWQDWMANNINPAEQDDCQPPFNEVLELMQASNVSGTPAILFENGKRINGFADASRLISVMKEKP